MSDYEPGMVVLDTNVVSFAHRDDPRYLYYEERIAGMKPPIALQTYQEIWFGARRDWWGETRLAEMAEFLKGYELVIPSIQTARVCGDIRALQRRLGKALSTADAWIVATALTLDCPLASHDGGLASVPGLRLIQAPDARI